MELKLIKIDWKAGKLTVSSPSSEFDGIFTLEKDASVFGLIAEEYDAFNQAFNDATEYDAELQSIEVKYSSNIRYANVKLRYTHPINGEPMECKPEKAILFEIKRITDEVSAEKATDQNNMIQAWLNLEEAVQKKWNRLAGTPQLKMNFDGE